MPYATVMWLRPMIDGVMAKIKKINKHGGASRRHGMSFVVCHLFAVLGVVCYTVMWPKPMIDNAMARVKKINKHGKASRRHGMRFVVCHLFAVLGIADV